MPVGLRNGPIVALSAVFSGVIAIVLLWLAYANAQADRRADFDQRALLYRKSIERQVGDIEDVAAVAVARLSIGEKLNSEAELMAFMEQAQAFREGMRHISFIARVRHEVREQFEQIMSTRNDWEIDTILEVVDGNPVPASVREIYYPITYISSEGFRQFRLWDLFGTGEYYNLVKEVEATRLPILSPLYDIMEDESAFTHGFRYVVPYWWADEKRNIDGPMGFLAIALKVEDLVRNSLDDIDTAGTKLVLLEQKKYETSPAPPVLFNGETRSAETYRATSLDSYTLKESVTLELPGQTWTLIVRGDPKVFPLNLLPIGMAGLAAVMIMILTIGGTAYLTSRRDRLEAVVEERTKELAAARDQAQSADRAKSEFLASMSHEIRTPLNGVLGMADVILNAETSDTTRDYASVIKESGENLLTILNDILDLSKIESGRLELEETELDLNDIISSLRKIWIEPFRLKNLTLDVDTDGMFYPYILGDALRIQQILSNLISNALKFTARGGVTIRIEQVPIGSDSVQTRFLVTDTGIGIAADVQKRLFNKFTQGDSSTTRKYGGTGLGLAICRQLSELMGGEVGCESVLGDGSTFWCSISTKRLEPSVDVLPVYSQTEQDAHSMSNGKWLRILVAEDNSANQDVIRASLRTLGHQVDIVENGRQAIDAAAGEPYDAILLDIRMPEMNGIDACRHIRRILGPKDHTFIAALTADVAEGINEACLEVGMDTVLPKPIKIDRLRAMLDAVGEDPSDLETSKTVIELRSKRAAAS